MLSQALRTRQRTSICRLQLHQRFNHRLTPTSPSEEEETSIPIYSKKKNQSQTAFIRTWEPFHNLADAWALLRVVERKYGKVVEAHFLKDYEIKNRYQMYTYVVFQDQESLKRVPKEGQSFHVPAPLIEDKPGGLGLDDIRHLLDSTDRDEFFQLPSAASVETEASKERVIGARIERAIKNYYTLPKAEHLSRSNIQLSKVFLRWGGFHKLEPIERRDITEHEWFEETDLEQLRMRAALQWCSQITGFANPAVLRKPIARAKDEKVLDSAAASASMDSLEPSSPPMLDKPISHISTSESTQSLLLPTEIPQSQSQPQPFPESAQPPSESTQPPPESASAPANLRPPQLTPEQLLAQKAMKRHMSRAKQMVKSKPPTAKTTQKPEEEKPKDQASHLLNEFPEEPPPQPKGVIATIWKLFGR